VSAKKPKQPHPLRTWRVQSDDAKHEMHFADGDGVEFDELVVGKHLHVEVMDRDHIWMAVGDASISLHIGRDGTPAVHIQRGEYGEIRGETIAHEERRVKAKWKKGST